MSYKEVLEVVNNVMLLTEEEKKWLLESKAAELGAMFPFISKAYDADRLSVRNLCNFVIAKRCRLFDARKSDFLGSTNRRLEGLFHGVDGDRTIIDAAKSRLTLCMFSDMRKDAFDDIDKYNLFKENSESAVTIFNGVIASDLSVPEVDAIMSVEQANEGSW